MSDDKLKEILYDLNLKINNAKTSMEDAGKYMSETESKLCDLMILELGVQLKNLFLASKNNLVFKDEILKAFMAQNDFIIAAVKNNLQPVKPVVKPIKPTRKKGVKK